MIKPETGDVNLPNFVYEDAFDVKTRFTEWTKDKGVVVFPIITDIHSGGSDKYLHIHYVNQLDRIFNYDFIANLGDIGLNSESTKSHKDAISLINAISSISSEYNGYLLFCKGNHDFDYGINNKHTYFLSDSLFSQIFQRYRKNDSTLFFYENSAYGYLDLKDKNIRVLYLNSSDSYGASCTKSYMFQKKQIQFLIDAMNSAPSGYNIVALMHRLPSYLSNWDNNIEINDQMGNGEIIQDVFRSYVKRMNGNSRDLDLSWDFSDANGNLVALFGGDSHFNAYKKIDGVNYFISQGYGENDYSRVSSWATYTKVRYLEEMCVDLVTIDYVNRQVAVFRIGAGGKYFDRYFSY